MPKTRRLNKSTLPKADLATEAAFGQFVIAWSMIEQQLDFAIHEISGMDWDLASCVTANLGTKAKLDIFHAMAHCLRDVLSPELLAMVDRLVADTGNASGRLRNFVIHGQPVQVELADGRAPFWAKLSARKGGLSGPMVRFSPVYVTEQVEAVKALFARWESARAAIFRLVEFLDKELD
jgi:hypothetical protein